MKKPKDTYTLDFLEADDNASYNEQEKCHSFDINNISKIINNGWSLLCLYGGTYKLTPTANVMEHFKLDKENKFGLALVNGNKTKIDKSTAESIIDHYGLDSPFYTPYYDDGLEKVYNI